MFKKEFFLSFHILSKVKVSSAYTVNKFIILCDPGQANPSSLEVFTDPLGSQKLRPEADLSQAWSSLHSIQSKCIGMDPVLRLQASSKCDPRLSVGTVPASRFMLPCKITSAGS